MPILDATTEEALIAHLLQFVTPPKQARMQEVLEKRSSYLSVVLEDIYQTQNASAVMRSCECFGIQHLHVVENRYKFKVNKDVTMGASKWVHLHRYQKPQEDNTATCINRLRQDGYRIIATSLDPASIPVTELSLDQKTSLWFGTEEEGLSDSVLREADAHVHIPMFGFTQSFNISVSAAICLYELRKRLDESGNDQGLSTIEKRAAYRLWLKGALKNHEILERTFLKALKQAH